MLRVRREKKSRWKKDAEQVFRVRRRQKKSRWNKEQSSYLEL